MDGSVVLQAPKASWELGSKHHPSLPEGPAIEAGSPVSLASVGRVHANRFSETRFDRVRCSSSESLPSRVWERVARVSETG